MVIGAGLLALAVFMLPAISMAAWIHSDHLAPFLMAAAITAVSGGVLWMLGHWHRSSHGLLPRQMFLITAGAWIIIPLFSALPLLFGGLQLSITDAVFEAVSGMTTTGSTILSGLDRLSPDLLLWRSQVQWLGGIGIIGMAAAVLPFLRVGGMKLFRTESSEWSDRVALRAPTLLKRMLFSYAVITLLCAAAYYLGGMSIFNAVNHALTTVATGGYSTSDASFGQFGPGIQWIGIVFMLSGGVPFVLYVRMMKEHDARVFIDRQVLALLGTLAGLVLLVAGHRVLTVGSDPGQAITEAAFNLVSVVTTTGYASVDYGQWGTFVVGIFLFATFIGGCSGSTSGGIKVFRLQLCLLIIRDQMSRAVHPNRVITRKYNGVVVNSEILDSLVAYLFLLVCSLVVVTLVLAALGLDLITSVSGAATALMNVGPGLGDIIGPAGNFATLPDTTKWVLCLAMIMGRLEFMAIIVPFTAGFWRQR